MEQYGKQELAIPMIKTKEMRKISYEKQTQIDKPQCPLGHGDMNLDKSWELKGKSKTKTTIVELWKCSECGKTVRISHSKPKKGEKTE